MKKLTVDVISDIHYYAKSVGTCGPEFQKANSKSTFDLFHTEEILEALKQQLLSDDSADIILCSGDLTNNGEPQSHEGAIKFLSDLKKAGKKVFAITATHDYRDNDETPSFTEDGIKMIKTPKREALFDMYFDFGPAQATSIHRESMSYAADLNDEYKLLALNDDHNNKGASGFSDELFSWIEKEVKKAQDEGKFIICMTHHPMISPSGFYSIIGKNDMMGEHEKRREQLADMGVNFILTGHTHIRDISYIESQKGNIFYDITTPAPVGYPGAYRKLCLNPDQREIEVKNMEISQKPNFDIKGSVTEHLKEKFFGMIRDIVIAAGTDTEKLARMATAFSVKPKLIYKIGFLIKPFAKIISKLKIKTAFKIAKRESGLKKEDIAKIGDEKVLDFIISLVANLYGGDSPYDPSTPYYSVTMGVCSIIDDILDTLHIKLSKILKGCESVSALVEPLLFNAGIPDKNAVLNLDELPKRYAPKEFKTRVKKSRKGPCIIICLVLLVILFLPLILLWLGLGFLINTIKFHGRG